MSRDTVADIVAELLGKAREGAPDPCSEFRRRSDADIESVDALWLWDGMLRDRQVNLVESKQGVGKSTFLIAVAVHGSCGTRPFGVAGSSFKTLYVGNEDEEGELVSVYRKLGGQIGFFIPVSEVWEFTDEGCTRLESLIKANSVGLVIIDPIKNFLPRGVSEIDNPGISKMISKLRAIAQRTGSCIVIVRHHQKYTSGKMVDEMGAGGAAWASSVRSQLALLQHPDIRKFKAERYVGVFPLRGSISAAKGEPIGFSYPESGEFGWIPFDAFDLKSYFEKYPDIADEYGNGWKPRGPRAPGGRPSKAVEDSLRKVLSSGPVSFSEARAKVMEDTGCSQSKVYQARASLGIVDEFGMWALPACNHEGPVAIPPRWADLEDGVDPFQ